LQFADAVSSIAPQLATTQEADMQKMRAHGVQAVFKPTTLYVSGM
jgi:hypothetical protein